MDRAKRDDRALGVAFLLLLVVAVGAVVVVSLLATGSLWLLVPMVGAMVGLKWWFWRDR